MPSRLLIALCLCLLGLPAVAFPSAQLMLFGVFHFANPQQDVIKTQQVDVMSPDNQAYLERLARRIAAFAPTAVLLEYAPEHQTEMQDRYRRYLAGDFELPSNEIYQLGFRIARLAGVETLHSVDEREIGWQAEALFARLEADEKPTKARLDAEIARITREMSEAHATLSLAALLAQANDPVRDRQNMGFYLLTNGVGAGAGFEGADAAASWWHRNFRMYARIQQHVAPGARILAVGGQGHTAILKQLASVDADVRLVDVTPYLSDP